MEIKGYDAKLWEEDGVWLIEVPELDIYDFGNSRECAIKNCSEAIDYVLKYKHDM